MQVLKFGGSSVKNAENINKVISIVKEKVKKDRTIVVVSALGGITDVLLLCSKLASEGNEEYKVKLQEAEQRHLQTVKDLVPITGQSRVLSLVKTLCNEIEDICNGIFLLRELSARTTDRVMSYGEILSSKIITAAFNSGDEICAWKDSKELIVTNSNFGAAAVDFGVTNERVSKYFSNDGARLYVMPGFISSDANGAVPGVVGGHL